MLSGSALCALFSKHCVARVGASGRTNVIALHDHATFFCSSGKLLTLRYSASRVAGEGMCGFGSQFFRILLYITE